MKVYERVQKAFPGGAGPAVVVVSAPDVTPPQVAAGIAALKRAALATGQMHEPISVEAARRARRPASRSRWPARAPTRRSNRALDTLRHDVIPATIGTVPGVDAQGHRLDGRVARTSTTR